MRITVEKYFSSEWETTVHPVGVGLEAAVLAAAEGVVFAHHDWCGFRDSNSMTSAREYDREGFKVYLDHYKSEVCAPLTVSACSGVLLFRKVRALFWHFKELAEKQTGPLRCSLNTTNRNGQAWGHHLNTLIARAVFDSWANADWDPLKRQWLPFIVSSPPLLGTGKVGAENDAPSCTYQLTQRFDFLSEEVGWETVERKNFINTRDEALADRRHYARLHGIWSDCNVLEFALFLKLGLNQILLALLEEDYPLPDLRLRDPLEARHVVGRDLTFRVPLALADGRRMRPLEIQSCLAEAAQRAIARGCAACAVPDAKAVLRLWQETLDDLEHRRARLARRLDWFAKLQILSRLESGGAVLDDLKLADLHFAELGGFFERLERESAVDRLEDFYEAPIPERPVLVERERLRAHLIECLGPWIWSADWDSLVVRRSEEDSLWLISLDFERSRRWLRAVRTCHSRESIFRALMRLGAVTKVVPLDDETEGKNTSRKECRNEKATTREP